MIITRIDAFAIKAAQTYTISGVDPQARLPGSEYLRMGDYPQLYSTRSQAALVRIETDTGLVGWGEAQAPVGTEIILTIIREVLGPAVMGRDALATGVRGTEMYETMRVRGQIGGYQQDAIAAIDTALWDIRGKAAGLSIAGLLGGRRRDRLPAYVSGLRERTPEGRRNEAAEWTSQGFAIKPFLGQDARADAREVEGLREAIGDDAGMCIDVLWSYSYAEAVRVGRVLERCGVEFLEAPLAPEDVAGHARLTRELDLPIAVGEPLRTRHQFLGWFTAEAMDVTQPDLMRNGITETVAIAQLADAFHIPVALHTGVVTVVGMAATWQVASTLTGFHSQEYQPVMLTTFNPWLDTPLDASNGTLGVPTGPGLGIDLDEERVRNMATSTVSLSLDHPVR